MSSQTCLRCGWVWEVNITRNNHELCESCRARKAYKITDCTPWHGRFGTDMVTPVDEYGREVLPGKRNCGRLDCVNTAHIERG